MYFWPLQKSWSFNPSPFVSNPHLPHHLSTQTHYFKNIHQKDQPIFGPQTFEPMRNYSQHLVGIILQKKQLDLFYVHCNS